MNPTFLVELPGESLVPKAAEDLQSDDMLVFDSPESFDHLTAAQAKLDAEIEAAGGLLAWRDGVA